MHLNPGQPDDLSAPDPSAIVPVTVVNSRMEAELIVGMLRSNGLRAATSAGGFGARSPQLDRRGVQVLVAPDDEAAARQLLASVEES